MTSSDWLLGVAGVAFGAILTAALGLFAAWRQSHWKSREKREELMAQAAIKSLGEVYARLVQLCQFVRDAHWSPALLVALAVPESDARHRGATESAREFGRQAMELNTLVIHQAAVLGPNVVRAWVEHYWSLIELRAEQEGGPRASFVSTPFRRQVDRMEERVIEEVQAAYRVKGVALPTPSALADSRLKGMRFADDLLREVSRMDADGKSLR